MWYGITLTVGIILLISSLFSLKESLEFLKTSERTVGVVINPDHPSESRLLTYFGVFFTTMILMAIAAPLIVIGGGYFLAKFVLV